MIKSINRHVLANVAMFAAAGAASGGGGKKPRGPEAIITAIAAPGDFAMPAPKARRNGSASKYPFDKLEIGGSFGITNKTAANMTSVLSAQNRKPGPLLTNEDGTPKIGTVMKPMKDAANKKIGEQPVQEQLTAPGKRFEAVDVDPKKDKDKATVRIFRRS